MRNQQFSEAQSHFHLKNYLEPCGALTSAQLMTVNMNLTISALYCIAEKYRLHTDIGPADVCQFKFQQYNANIIHNNTMDYIAEKLLHIMLQSYVVICLSNMMLN